MKNPALLASKFWFWGKYMKILEIHTVTDFSKI